MKFRIVIHPKALKEIQKLSFNNIQRVEKKIEQLSENPRPSGFKKLVNFSSERVPGHECFRIRVGDIRIIYSIQEGIITITIAQVEKRGDIY